MKAKHWSFTIRVGKRGTIGKAILVAEVTEKLTVGEAKQVARVMADHFGRPVEIHLPHRGMMFVSRAAPNPTLVHHGWIRQASHHVLQDWGGDSPPAPLADLYSMSDRDAQKVATALASGLGRSVVLMDNTGLPSHLSTHPSLEIAPLRGGPRRLRKPKRHNPTDGRLRIGDLWTTLEGGKCKIIDFTNTQVQVRHMETGNREWIERGEFFASYRPMRVARNPGRALSVPEQHQLKIARATLRMSDVGARIMGGPTKAEAREIVRRLTGREPVENPSRSRRARYQRGARRRAPKGVYAASSRRAHRALAAGRMAKAHHHMISSLDRGRFRALASGRLVSRVPNPKARNPLDPFTAGAMVGTGVGFGIGYSSGKRRRPNPKGRNPTSEPIAYGQTIGRDWAQEWYESATGHARIRAAQLRKLGYRVATESSSQVTPVGRVRMTLVDIRGGDMENLPPVRVERTPNRRGRNPRDIAGEHLVSYLGGLAFSEDGKGAKTFSVRDAADRFHRSLLNDGDYEVLKHGARFVLMYYGPLPAANPGGPRIVYNRLLGGWYVVVGPHQTPLNGRFNSKAEAQAWLSGGPARRTANPKGRNWITEMAEYHRDMGRDAFVDKMLGVMPAAGTLRTELRIAAGKAWDREHIAEGRKMAAERRAALKLFDAEFGAPNPRGRKFYHVESRGGAHLVIESSESGRGKRLVVSQHASQAAALRDRNARMASYGMPAVNPRAPFAQGERVSVPYTGRASYFGRTVKRSREKGIIQGYAADGTVHVIVHRGHAAETHYFPESAVRRLPMRGPQAIRSRRKTVKQRLELKSLRQRHREAVAAAEKAGADRDCAEAQAKQLQPEMGEPASAEYRRLRSKLLKLTAEAEAQQAIALELERLDPNYVDPWALPTSALAAANRRARPTRRHLSPRRARKPRSRRLNPRHGGEMARARRMFDTWHDDGRQPSRITRVRIPPRPRALARLGELVSVVYESDKYAGSKDNPNGRQQLHEHRTKRPRPVLAADGDGHIHIVSGRMRPTADGLIN